MTGSSILDLLVIALVLLLIGTSACALGFVQLILLFALGSRKK